MSTGQDRTLPTNNQELLIAWPLHHSNASSINTNTGNQKTLVWHCSEETSPNILAIMGQDRGTAAKAQETEQAREANGKGIWDLGTG